MPFSTWLRNRFFAKLQDVVHTRSKRSRRRQAKLTLEILEDRLNPGSIGGGGGPPAMTYISVTTTQDDPSGTPIAGQTTLRDAINQANSDSGSVTIQFSTSGAVELAADLPAITTTSLTIDGSTDPGVTVQGNGYAMLMDQANVTLNAITFTGGTATVGNAPGATLTVNAGAVLDVNGTLSLGDVSGDSAYLYNNGTVSVTGNIVGGAYVTIYNQGTATMDVTEDLSVGAAGQVWNGMSGSDSATLTVGGNLTLGASGSVYASYLYEYGTSQVTVSGNLTLEGSNSSAYLGNSSTDDVTCTVGGAFSMTDPYSYLAVEGTSQMTVTGNFTLSSDSVFVDDGTMAVGGTFDPGTGDPSINDTIGGTFNAMAGSSVTTDTATWEVQAGGLLDVEAGASFTIAAGGTLIVDSGGLLLVSSQGTFTNNGTLDYVLNWTWTGSGGNGNWDNSANWSTSSDPLEGVAAATNSYPGQGTAAGEQDYVTIDTQDAATITVQTGDNLSVQELSTAASDTLAITGGSLAVAGNATLQGALSMTGGSLAMAGASSELAGSVTTTSGTTLSVTAGLLTISGTANISGSVSLTGGALEIGGGSQIDGGLTLNSSSSELQLTGALTIDGSSQWTEGTVNLESYTLTNQGTLTLGTQVYVNGNELSGSLVNDGTVAQQAGAGLLLVGDSQFVNAQSGTFDIEADNGISSPDSSPVSFTNDGLLEKTAGTGTSTIAVSFSNDGGTITADTGTISFTAGLNVTNGTFNANGTATVNLTGGNSTDTLAGALTGTGTGTVLFDNGAIDVSGGTNFDFPSHLLDFGVPSYGSTEIYVEGAGVVNSGYMTITGGNVIFSASTSATFSNSGTIIQSGSFSFVEYVELENAAGGTLEIAGDFDIYGNEVTNQGLLEKTAGSGTSTISYFTNDEGTVSADSGTLSLGNSVLQGGTYNANGTATIELQGSYNGASLASGTLTGSGTGQVLFDNNIDVGTGGLTLDFPGSLFQWTGGILSGANGNVTNLGTLNLSGSAEKIFDNDGTLFNEGTIIQTGSGNFGLHGDSLSPTTLDNEQGASYLIEGDGGVDNPYGGATAIINAGTISVDTGGGTSEILVDGTLTNSGTIEAVSGTLELNATMADVTGNTLTEGTWEALSGSTLEFPANTDITTNQGNIILYGGATIAGIGGLSDNAGSFTLTNGANFATGAFTNDGTLTVGTGSILSVAGDFSQSSGASLNDDIGGSPTSGLLGQLTISGTATLAGTFNVDLINGAAPSRNGVYPVMTFASSSISFSSVTGVSPNFTEAISPTSIDLVAGTGAPVNLQLSQVTAPTAATVGQEITVGWQVSNPGSSAISGSWQDSVYLSSTATITSSSVLLGSFTNSNSLAADGMYTGTLTAAVPELAPGNYYVLVAADSLDQLTLANRASDTVAAGTGQVNVSLPALTLGTPYDGSFSAAGQNQYYQVAVPAGGSLVVTLASNATSGTVGLYVSNGAEPTPYSYDEGSDAPNQPMQTVIVPQVAAPTTYYILAESIAGAAATAGYVLSTDQTSALGVTGLSFTSAGNGGSATVAINGTNFAPDATAELTLGSTTIDATSIQFVNASQIYAVFNLTGAATGNYTLSVQQGAQSADAPTTFQVLPAATSASLELNLITPSAVRAGGYGVAYVTVTNNSNNDVGAPLLSLSGGGDATLSLASDPGDNSNLVTFLATSPTGLPGTLTAGESVTIPINFQSTTSNPTINFQLNNVDPSSAMDWSQVDGALLMNEGSSEPNVSAALTYLQNQVGPTWGDYAAMLDQYANLISVPFGSASDPDALLDLAFNNALAAVNSSISGTLQSQAPGIQIAGVTIDAVNNATQQTYSEYSLNDGSFVFPALPAGTYTISVPGSLVVSGGSVTVANGPVTGANVTLGALDNISGQVVNPTTGQPFAGLPVYLNGPNGTTSSTTTDSNGDYQFSSLGAGSYTVYLPLGGPQASDTVSITQLNGGTLTANLQLAYAATLGGTLLDAAGDPIADGTVTLYFAGQPIDTAQTDASGSYQFEIVTPGTFDVLATSPEGTYPMASGVQVASGAAVTQNFQTGTGTLSVTVMDGSEPVSGDPVTIEALVNGVETPLMVANASSGGIVSFANLTAGSYTVVATGTTGDTSQTTVTVAAGGSAQATVSLTAQAAVSGTVTDSSGNPIDAAIVILQSTSNSQQRYSVSTGAYGTYAFTSVVPGTYDLTTFGDGYQALTQTSINIVGAATVNASLAPSTTTITGSAVDLSGAPAPGGEVVVYDASQHVIAMASVQENGSFQVTSAFGSNLTLQIFTTGYGVTAPIPFNAPVGSSVQLAATTLTPMAVDAYQLQSPKQINEPVMATINGQQTYLGNLFALIGQSVFTPGDQSQNGNPRMTTVFTNSGDPGLTSCGNDYTFQIIQVALVGTRFPVPTPLPILDDVPYLPVSATYPFGNPFLRGTNIGPNYLKFSDTPGLGSGPNYQPTDGDFISSAFNRLANASLDSGLDFPFEDFGRNRQSACR